MSKPAKLIEPLKNATLEQVANSLVKNAKSEKKNPAPKAK